MLMKRNDKTIVMNEEPRRVLKRLHYPLDFMSLCVRRYAT